MVLQAIGQITKKPYAKGENKADIFKQLNTEYPSFVQGKTRENIVEKVLPEPLIFVNERRYNR